MTQIEQDSLELGSFICEVAAMVAEVVESSLSIPEIPGVPRMKKCLKEDCVGYLRLIKGVNGHFFACPVCKRTFGESKGEPVEKKDSSEVIEADFPLGCGKKARQFTGTYGKFWKCFCSPDTTFKDVDGKPAARKDRLKAPCPVRGCKGQAEKLEGKNGTFWKCKTCQNFFDDVKQKTDNRYRSFAKRGEIKSQRIQGENKTPPKFTIDKR